MSAKERYEAMMPDRTQFLQRARANAMLTIPSLMPLEGHDGKAHLIEPYQGLGATGVISLTSRLALALLPAGRPHLRLDVSNKILFQMEGEMDPEVVRNLSKSETLIQSKVEAVNWRATTLASVAQLIVAGSVIEHMLPDGALRLFRLDQFVWRRDHRGRVIECVIKEVFDKEALPMDINVSEEAMSDAKTAIGSKGKQVEIYTHIKLKIHSEGADYIVTREDSKGLKVAEDEAYAEDKVPYLFLRWSEMPGEDYGRSKVEEVVADLRSLEGLEKASIELGAMAAKNFIMVRPSASAGGLKNRITRINNGDVVMGDPDTVELKQFANGPGYQILDAQINRVSERVGRAFLLSSPGQRNAERVTATEIERDIRELESTLGGTFSVLSLEMLERRTQLLIERMILRDEFPDIDTKEAFNVTILTGLEALSRERDVQRGIQAAQIVQMFGEQGVDAVKLEVVLNKIFVGLGFTDAIRSAEEVAQIQQQRQQAEMMQRAAGPAAGAAMKGMTEGGPTE